MQPASYDVCDSSRIYNAQYNYSLPKNILEGFLSGKAFDNKIEYTTDESARLRKDINALNQSILSQNPVNEKIAVMTAGAPGAGKTTLMKRDLADKAAEGKVYAYICPDDVCLQTMSETYLAEIEKSDKSKDARQAAYNKWRPGSNASTHLILGDLIRQGYGFYFGTTSSGPATGKFFEFLKQQGYHIRLIYISAPDDVRWGSIQERDKTFVQTTEQDVREKGDLLPQRINDTFMKYADEIEFYYRVGVHEKATLTATWLRNPSSAPVLGALQVHNADNYVKIKAIHNAVAEKLKRPDLDWDKSVEKISTVAAGL